MNTTSDLINQQLAVELSINSAQVQAFVSLYDDGNTVPFIARYRKEKTQGLDDTQLRTLETRLNYLRELSARRLTILKKLNEDGKLSELLKQQITGADSKQTLEDLYAPYKSKRVSKGQLAIVAGLEVLADKLWFQGDSDQLALAKRFIKPNMDFPDSQSVLDGAMAIIVERICSEALLVDKLRKHLLANGQFEAKLVKGQEQKGSKYKDYFDYQEPIKKMPAHRLLAILRGKSEGYLKLMVNADPKQDKSVKSSYCETLIANHLGFSLYNLSPNNWRRAVIRKAWKSKLSGQLESQLISHLKEQAHENAMLTFAANMKDLLMAAPAGKKITLGLDPGLRTGCKLAVIDGTGKLLDFQTIYPHAPANKQKQAADNVKALINRHNIELIAIGNGTASRESDHFIRELLNLHNLTIPVVIVSEAGASVYSASALAAEEFPNIDVSIRGAVSIARRLQDPLAELVKIDAKAIGVGLYQHDVNQSSLGKKLDAVVEDCVNAVGVELNSASVSLLTHVAGLNQTIAQNIIDYRDQYGVFTARHTLKKVPRLGAKAYQQCAGFLRINLSSNPLDNSAVHPEAYDLVKRIAAQQNTQVKQLLTSPSLLDKINPNDYCDQQFGLLSIKDILAELRKPGRDPRPEFKRVDFAENINQVSDLTEGMTLQGVISNVTNFGAFVDIGVHQDGLVHISQLADTFVADPFAVVKAGQIVTVRVMEVDLQRKRIALTMKKQQA